MRSGDFSVDVVSADGGALRETDTGHVLARAGQVYRLRLRNFGPLSCVAKIEIDGRCITAGGLVLAPWGTTVLERPLDDTTRGCFTVFAEGNETVFGADGGRDNASLGLIDARFRRELPTQRRLPELPPSIYPPPRLAPIVVDPAASPPFQYPRIRGLSETVQPVYSLHTIDAPPNKPPASVSPGDIERAAGTGLTGHSDQEFAPATLGTLERDATVIQLRLVIGSEAALDANSRDAATETVAPSAPVRPAARP